MVSQNQLKKHTYYYWKRKLADLDSNRSDPALFVEVPSGSVASKESISEAMVIQWNELSIQVTDSHSVSLAAELLEKLQKLC